MLLGHSKRKKTNPYKNEKAGRQNALLAFRGGWVDRTQARRRARGVRRVGRGCGAVVCMHPWHLGVAGWFAVGSVEMEILACPEIPKVEYQDECKGHTGCSVSA